MCGDPYLEIRLNPLHHKDLLQDQLKGVTAGTWRLHHRTRAFTARLAVDNACQVSEETKKLSNYTDIKTNPLKSQIQSHMKHLRTCHRNPNDVKSVDLFLEACHHLKGVEVWHQPGDAYQSDIVIVTTDDLLLNAFDSDRNVYANLMFF